MNDPSHSRVRAPARRGLLGAVGLALLTVAAYAPALRGEFVWDDLVLVARNPLVTGEANVRSVWFAGDFSLTTFALWLQWLVWGDNAAGYHTVNVALHTANGLLFWRVLRRLGVAGAGLAAGLFAVHPVAVASAAWISELKNTLSLAFFLASLLAWLRFDDQQAGLRPPASPPRFSTPASYRLSLVAFLLALMSKTSTVMLPMILLGCVWWRRGRIAGRDVLAAIPFLALSLMFAALTIWYQTHQAVRAMVVQTEDFWARLAGAGQAVWFYLGKALWPVHLSMIYPHWTVEGGEFRSFVPLLLLVIVLAGCAWFRRSWGRHALLALVSFVACLFPALGFFDMYFMVFSRVSDHFAYLALLPVTALVAAGMSRLPGIIRPAAGFILVAALGVLTFQRANVFATEESLWRDTLAKNPAAWSAHNNLGALLAERGQVAKAVRHFETALRLNPRNIDALVNLGRASAMARDFARAEAHFQAALRIKPDDAAAHRQYGLMQLGLRDYETGIKHLAESVRLRPDAGTRLELATAYRATGRLREAIAECRAAVRASPNQADALANLAWLLATVTDDSLRDGAEAVRLAERACALTGHRDAHKAGVLAAAYAEAGRFDRAAETARRAIELARAAGNFTFAAANEQLLRLYESERPHRE